MSRWFSIVIGVALAAVQFLCLAASGYADCGFKLLAGDGANRDEFGLAVSLSGDVAVIGAYRDDDNGISCGSAYVFRWDGALWREQQKLLPDDGAPYDEFGISVSISGDVAVIGAHTDDDNGTDSGSAYVFRWDGTQWRQEQKKVSRERWISQYGILGSACNSRAIQATACIDGPKRLLQYADAPKSS